MLMTGSARARDEGGAVAVIVALFGIALLVVAALVVDIAQARLDRQASKSASDASVMAGLKFADGGTASIYNVRAVCGALAFLKANEPALSGLPAGTCTGSWATDTTVCDPVSPTPFEYTGAVSSGGVDYTVRLASPYQLSDGGFPEESYATSTGDVSLLSGCDQLAVIITKSRDPHFGAVVSSAPLTTTIRSVGRIIVDPGETAPALLLLERAKCNVLTVGSAGSGSRIWVYGSADIPASIHADTAATDTCADANDKRVFQGNQATGIVAYGSNDGDAGLISSYAGMRGIAAGIVSDGLDKVHSTTAQDELGAGTKSAPIGRDQIGRRPVDERYRSGVKSALTVAASEWALSPAAPTGWTRVGCAPAATTLATAAKLYVDCSASSGITLGTQAAPAVINATEVFFNGFIKGNNISMPNAQRVYVSNRGSSGSQNSASALALTNNQSFCIKATGCDVASPTTGSCPTTGAGSAKLFILHGNVKSTGSSLLRMCNTTVFLQGGQTDGCVPSADGALPTDTPCSGTAGTGQITASGNADWTAPNAYPGAVPEADQPGAWAGGEDLALWAESAATSSDKFVLGGGGALSVMGVFFTPNALPFQLNGGAAQDLTNAQFVTRSFALGGGSNLRMRVDPNNAVTIPELQSYLVR